MADNLFVSEILKGMTQGFMQGMQLRQQRTAQEQDAAFRQQQLDIEREKLDIARGKASAPKIPTAGEQGKMKVDYGLVYNEKTGAYEPLKGVEGLRQQEVKRRTQSYERGLEVPDFGYAKTPKGATKAKEATEIAFGAVADINELIELTNTPGAKLSLPQRKRASEIAQGLVGLSRLPYFGPGILTDFEQTQMREIIADPTKFKNFYNPANKASLESMKQRFMTKVVAILKTEGITDESGKKLDYEKSVKDYFSKAKRIDLEDKQIPAGQTSINNVAGSPEFQEIFFKFLESVPSKRAQTGKVK